MSSGRFIILFILVSVAIRVFPQTKLNELTVDRPGIAESPFTVDKGSYQFEIGFDYFNRANGDIYHLPAILFRTGLGKEVELRISSRHLIDNTEIETFKGISPLSFGLKFQLIKEKDWIPEIDVLTNVVIPVEESTSRQNIGPELLLLFQNELAPKSTVTYNLGFLWDYIRARNFFAASFCYNYLASDRVGLFVEYFSYYPQNFSEQGMDGGLTYLITNSVQLDLSAGISHVEKRNNLFVSTGFSFRID